MISQKGLLVKLLSVVVLVLCFTASAVGNEYSRHFFSRIDVKSGLSENNVKTIMQDSWGFMWFGTKNGLNRYDGNNIRHFVVDDVEKGMGNHNISALCEDSARQIWVGTDKGVYIYNYKDEKFTRFDKQTKDGEQVTNWISQIVADKDSNIWIISPVEGAFRYNMADETLSLYDRMPSDDSFHYNPECICVRPNGDVWIGTTSHGLFRYDNHTDRLEQFIEDAKGVSLAGRNIFAMCNYGDQIAIGLHEHELVFFDPNTRQLTVAKSKANYRVIRSLAYSGEELFVGTQDGLVVIGNDGRENHIRSYSSRPFSLSNNIIYSICVDRDKGLWLGTGFNGVNYTPYDGVVFRNHAPAADRRTPTNGLLREMVFDKNGHLWIASEEGTLNIYDPKEYLFYPVDAPIYKGGGNRLGLMADGDKIWSGVFKNGLDIIDINTKAVTHYSPQQLGMGGEGSPYAIFKDREGRIWVGSGHGVYLKNQDMTFKQIGAMNRYFVQDITQDRDGNIWVATMGSGICCYNPSTDECLHYQSIPNDSNSLSSNSVSSISTDSHGNLWFSTDRGGICKYDIEKKTFKTISIAQGLPDDIAYKILFDSQENLWFGTNQGLVRFTEQTGEVRVFRSTGGQGGNQYHYKSAAMSTDGKFFFGGAEGMLEFDPMKAVNNKEERQAYITNITLDGKVITLADISVISTEQPFIAEIDLPYDMSSITIDISSFDYEYLQNEDYEYKLIGIDKDWMTNRGGKSITYTKLPPGSYKFKVKIAGKENHDFCLQINVARPWYNNMWSWAGYILIILLIAYVIYRRFHQRQLRQLELREVRYKEAKDKEVMQSKIDFFTNITHEIRTPLTLINGSLENIQTENIVNSTVKRNISAIGKNCHRLLELVNQLLDFRRINTKTMELYMTNIDICEMVTNIVERFEPGILHLNKIISVDTEDTSIIVPIDPEAITKIMSNLLNNARKYSDSFISVHIRRTDNEVEIEVINDGAKIPASKAEQIFTPFIQLDESNRMGGSGIGLPLARSLAEMHNGSLVLDTNSEYNMFVLRLPLHQENVVSLVETGQSTLTKQIVNDTVPQQNEHVMNEEKKEYTVLVVEDNSDLLQMIKDKLSDTYEVETATNGRMALMKIKQDRIDLVISDIMMPEMDGLELTRMLKDDIEINHIPIILLTAKNTIENRIEGLKVGADAYIDKPFNFNYLQQQVATLLENRRRERESFLHKPYLPVEGANVNRQGEEFLRRISDFILMHIDQPGFNVEQLAQEMCMSRSSLHRKIKEVSNLTPIDFIRLIRLKKAAELIRKDGLRINEVCEKVGIQSPSYFIKLFQKQFGMTPKEFANSDKTIPM